MIFVHTYKVDITNLYLRILLAKTLTYVLPSLISAVTPSENEVVIKLASSVLPFPRCQYTPHLKSHHS